jgi:hypothetical protein
MHSCGQPGNPSARRSSMFDTKTASCGWIAVPFVTTTHASWGSPERLVTIRHADLGRRCLRRRPGGGGRRRAFE